MVIPDWLAAAFIYDRQRQRASPDKRRVGRNDRVAGAKEPAGRAVLSGDLRDAGRAVRGDPLHVRQPVVVGARIFHRCLSR